MSVGGFLLPSERPLSADEDQLMYENQLMAFAFQQALIEEERYKVKTRINSLQIVANSAALLGGFGSTFLAQVAIPTDGTVSNGVLVAFGGLSAVIVSMNVLSVMITSLILVQALNFDTIESATSTEISKRFSLFWKLRCENDWLLAYTCFIVSIPVYLVASVLCGWVQFRGSNNSLIAVTVVGAFTLLVGAYYVFPWLNFSSTSVRSDSVTDPDLFPAHFMASYHNLSHAAHDEPAHESASASLVRRG